MQLLAVLLMLAVLPGGAAARELPDFTGLVEQNSAAVVNISTSQHIRTERRALPEFHGPEGGPLSDLFRKFFEEDGAPIERDSRSLGSGFIISADGYILTNHHVVDGADEILVRLSDRKSYRAKVIGSDEQSDIALLKVDADNLPVARIGTSNDLKVGEWVLAIGSPFGFDHSVTAGIVSAKGRSLPSENYVPYIQTDVAINPGNSGGPLFDLQGRVVGVNSQIYSRTGGFMGLSFAIPIDLAMSVVEQLKTSGHVTRGYLGVIIQEVDHSLAEALGMGQPSGALVARVLDGSPAAKAGIKVGDVILRFDGHELHNSTELPPLVGATPVGNAADLSLLRDGNEISLKVILAALPSGDEVISTERPQSPSKPQLDRLGLQVEALDEAMRQELGVPDGQGVLIARAEEGAAQTAGIAAGDVILMIDGQRVSDPAQFASIVSELKSGRSVAVLLQRDQGPAFIALRVP